MRNSGITKDYTAIHQDTIRARYRQAWNY